MADARITELTSAAWSSALTFAVVDAGTTKRVGSDQFLLTTTAQASAVAQVVAAAAVSGKLTGTTAQVVSAAGGGVATSVVTHVVTTTGIAVSAKVSKDEVTIIVSGVSFAGGSDFGVVLSSTSGASYVTSGYYSWANTTALSTNKLNASSWLLADVVNPAADDVFHIVATIRGLRCTDANARKVISWTGVEEGGPAFSGGGYLANSSVINAVRVSAIAQAFDNGSITIQQSG